MVSPAPISINTATDSGPVGPTDRRGSSVLFWAGMPVFLVVLWVGTYLAISSQELDSIEKRVLNYDQLSSSLFEHLKLTGISTLIVIVIAIPLGVLVTRRFARRSVPVVLGVANIGQGVPSYGLIAVMVILFGIGFTPVIIGLVAYSALPILRNTMVGLQQVDRNLIKAARGMGMSPTTVLTSVELPLAIPVMIAGIRTALIINVGTAALATFFGAGGLGFEIYNGLTLNRDAELWTGVVMIASLALLIDYLGKVAGKLLSPRGL